MYRRPKCEDARKEESEGKTEGGPGLRNPEQSGGLSLSCRLLEASKGFAGYTARFISRSVCGSEPTGKTCEPASVKFHLR